MSRNIFGWDLPPGCSMGDIERAYGDQPLMDEIFEQQNLSESEKKVWAQIYDLDEQLFNLLIRAMEWSHRVGYDACQSDKAEAEFYEEMARDYKQGKEDKNEPT